MFPPWLAVTLLLLIVFCRSSFAAESVSLAGQWQFALDRKDAGISEQWFTQFAFASGKFQLACYKEEIEANLRTPGLAGFQLLEWHDYVGQGTALVGLLDTFWESKGCATPDEFKKFCNTVVPLARLTRRVLTTADKFDVSVEVVNYGATPLTNAIPQTP
jgi:hypothetical protein